jgi:hypothetical protein
VVVLLKTITYFKYVQGILKFTDLISNFKKYSNAVVPQHLIKTLLILSFQTKVAVAVVRVYANGF